MVYILNSVQCKESGKMLSTTTSTIKRKEKATINFNFADINIGIEEEKHIKDKRYIQLLNLQ